MEREQYFKAGPDGYLVPCQFSDPAMLGYATDDGRSLVIARTPSGITKIPVVGLFKQPT